MSSIKGKYIKRRRSKALAGVAEDQTTSGSEAVDLIVTAFWGAIVGSALGKHSLWLGIPATIIAAKWKDPRKPLLVAWSVGVLLSNGWQAGKDELSQRRAGSFITRPINYFRSFGDKLYLNSSQFSSPEENLKN